MATLLHDAIMNPAEGKMSHTGVFALFKCCSSTIQTSGGAPAPAINNNVTQLEFTGRPFFAQSAVFLV